jgi:hypothetical protein
VLLVRRPDGTYRAGHDAFTVYTPVVSWFFVNRVVVWEVRRDGITRIYGSDANAGFCQDSVEYGTADCVEPVRWYPTRIENAHGNRIDIAYRSFLRGSLTMPQDNILDMLETRSRRIIRGRYPGIRLDGGARTALAKDPLVDRLVRAAPVGARVSADHQFPTDLEQCPIGADSRKLLPVSPPYNGGSHVIDIVYESRPDPRAERQDGVERTLFKRVSRVDVNAIRDGTPHLAFR